MLKRKNILHFLLAAVILGALIFPVTSLAQDEQPTTKTLPTIYFFRGDGCPHCAAEEEFLQTLKTEYPTLKVVDYEVWYNQDNVKKLQQVAERLNIKSAGVPVTVIGESVVVGFTSAETTGGVIRKNIEACIAQGCIDAVSLILAGTYQASPSGANVSEAATCDDQGACSFKSKEGEFVNLPLIGPVNVGQWSLPVLTIVIAALDGFNPCAMWVLIFLISLLLSMEDKKKMWILGSSFIITSGVIYFLFLAAWLNLFIFLGFISYVRIAIGIVAIASGVYHLREWYVNKSGLCKVTNQEQKRKIMAKLKQVSEQKVFWLALVGIIGVAIAVNMVELVCSAGLPAIYTHILSLSNLSAWQYYAYLLLYIIIFMFDDMFIFGVAMVTLQSTGLSGKYSRWSSLVGGAVILILGLLLIFKPAWIMFS